jgi:molybdopterin-guanine dinucleotide biosynthesis protein A
VLSGNPELAAYAPIVPDIHPNCGPMSGIEAALIHSIFEWNLFLPVDMPFLPSAFISSWLQHWLSMEEQGERIRLFQGARVCMFKVDGRPQPGFCLVHRDVLPFLTAALERGDFKLMTVFEEAGRELAVRRGFLPGAGLWNVPMNGFRSTRGQKEEWCYTTEAQQAAKSLWFANLNTPEEFAEAELHLDALDT